MNFKLFIFFFFGFLLATSMPATAQTKGKAKLSPADSAKLARKQSLDSAAAVRAYKSSKRYRDSVARARKTRTDSIKTAREQHTDSLKGTREAQRDSMLAAREKRTDSVQAQQKQRQDALNATKRYKASKRYADSVAIIKRKRTDDLKASQKASRDALAATRKKSLDSMKAIIKHNNDSMKLVRTKSQDSLKLVRKRRTDSLTKARMAKVKTIKEKEKTTEQKKKLAFELKLKAKREAYTNQSMLKKKWGASRRFFQNSFTHYNYFYNANRKMEEAKANMLRGIKKENYDSLIGLYPFDPDRDSSLLSGDMDSIIRRISVGIQIHDPRTKWADDLYLLMGEAYYYKGSYQNAAATFKYIINSDEENKKKSGNKSTSIVDDKKSFLDFLKRPPAHNDAILWLARTFVQARQVENGMAVLSLLASEPKLPEDLAGKVAEGKAYAFLADKNYTAAVDQLAIVVEDDYQPDWLRTRAAFLLGQLYQMAENYPAAVASFDRCLDFFPKLEMDFAARRLIAYNTLAGNQDVADGIKPLKKILNDAKYNNYHDQVYYVLGMISAKAGRVDDAINYLSKSTAVPRATRSQKAQSFVALGDAYYTKGMYTQSRNAYDSAIKFGAASPAGKGIDIKAITQKSKGLNEVAQPTQIIAEQDSLLALAALSPKEQQSAVRYRIQQMERVIRDSIKKAKENAAEAETSTTTDVVENTPGDNWYFNNPTTMQQGAAEFKKRWGNRQLADNWRRSTALAATGALNNNNTTAETVTDETPEKKQDINGLPSEEYLLAGILNTPEQKKAAEGKLQKAYIALANAYYQQLDDYYHAGKTLDTLNARFPAHPYKEDELYLRYQLFMRQNKLSEAQAIASEFLKKYPDSRFAAKLKPSSAKSTDETVATYYDQTYTMIVQHKYADALTRIAIAKSRYRDSIFSKRFQVAEAMAYAAMGRFDESDSLTAKFIAANTGDSLVSWAQSIQAYVKDVRVNGVPTWYKNLPPVSESGLAVTDTKVDTPKTPDQPKINVPKRPDDVPRTFSYRPDEEHYVMLVLNTFDSRIVSLKKELVNMDSTAGKHDVYIDMYTPRETVILVKSLGDAAKAKAFLARIADVVALYQSNELKQMVVSASNYKKIFWEKDSEVYLDYYREKY